MLFALSEGVQLQLSLTALKTLAAVIEQGSFSSAARQLGYTQSAVSQQIATLERALDLQLFERNARSIRPTEAARFLYSRSEELIGLVSLVESDVERLAAGQAGRIRIGSFSSADADLLSGSLARFLTGRRDIDVRLQEGEPFELVPHVVCGDLDVGLVFRYEGADPPWPVQLRATTLMREPLYVVAPNSHRFATCPRVALTDLAEEVWISNREDTLAHACLLTMTSKAGFRPNIAFRTNNFGAVIGLARAGLGIALIPALAFPPNSGLVQLRINDLPYRSIAAVTRELAANVLVESFLEALGAVAIELSSQHEEW